MPCKKMTKLNQVKKAHMCVLLKGQKQSLYLPEKNKKSFHFLLWDLGRVFVQIWEIMQIIQHFFPNYDYVSMTPCL